MIDIHGSTINSMPRGQLEPWLWVLLAVFILIVAVSYGAFEIIGRQGGNAWDILTMLS